MIFAHVHSQENSWSSLAAVKQRGSSNAPMLAHRQPGHWVESVSEFTMTVLGFKEKQKLIKIKGKKHRFERNITRLTRLERTMTIELNWTMDIRDWSSAQKSCAGLWTMLGENLRTVTFVSVGRAWKGIEGHRRARKLILSHKDGQQNKPFFVWEVSTHGVRAQQAQQRA